MTEKTKTRLVVGLFIAFLVLCMIFMLFSICEDIKAEEIETLINEYPFWAVSASGDSTFQTVQVLKCRQIFPNGQKELLGYKVVVDSSGIRIHEEEIVWFLNWAVWDALRLQVRLGKQKGD